MRGKTAKKLRKLARDTQEVEKEYVTKVVKTLRFEDGTIIERKQTRLAPDCIRYAYQRLKAIWPKKKEQLNLISRGL
jgi:hypothetical protein